jgi:hypothetical protein
MRVWELFVEQNGKSIDELFEFLSGRMFLNCMVHNPSPELCQGLIINVNGSLEARKLPYPNGKKPYRLFKTVISQNEPSEPKMTAMSKILRGELTGMECSEEFSIVHRQG